MTTRSPDAPECAVHHRVAHGFERLVDALRDDDTLARGEAVRLDDDGRALRAHVLLCSVRVVENLERSALAHPRRA